MTWPTNSDGWVIGSSTDGSARLMVTHDGGSSWTSDVSADVTTSVSVLFADPDNGWIAGEAGLASTHDGGATWTPVEIAGGITTAAALTASAGIVSVAYLGAGGDPGGGVRVATSPVGHDAFTDASIVLPFGAGPVLDVSISTGGPYGELVYNDRVFTGAGEIRDGRWAAWDLSCPYANPVARAGLSADGSALAIACGPSGFGDDADIVGADLSSGTLQWATIESAPGTAGAGQAQVVFATATNGGIRVVGFTTGGGVAEIASSADGGATWQISAVLPDGAVFGPIVHLAEGGLLLAADQTAGWYSSDGLTWTAEA